MLDFMSTTAESLPDYWEQEGVTVLNLLIISQDQSIPKDLQRCILRNIFAL